MHQQPSALFHFPNADGAGMWFSNPDAILTTCDASQVVHTLAEVSLAVKNGAYAAGFLAYEAAPAFDDALSVKAATGFPLLWFGLFSSPQVRNDICDKNDVVLGKWQADVTEGDYAAAFSRIADGIRAGETYQVNSTFRLRSQVVCDPLQVYQQLQRAHPGAYSCFIDTGDFAIASLSPELLFDLKATDTGVHAVTQPMKGTIKRGRWLAEDRDQARRLTNSAKDRAENVMIVDLMRNDFGKVAKVGSVIVPSLFDVAPLPTVWQMTSTVECDLPNSADFATVLGAVFPAGSVTGAPKAQSMKIIKETEKSPRNIYCGSIGYAAPGGRSVFNVAIRTVLIDKRTGSAECGVGGAITADSQCKSEHDEAMAKSLFLIASAAPIELLETMVLEDGSYFLLDRHLNRLADSAEYFGIDIDLTRVRKSLTDYASKIALGNYRVRLTVDHAGDSILASTPITEEEQSVREVALADGPIDIDSPFIFNKTTRRGHYARFRASVLDTFDTLLYNDRLELTEFTTGNVVAKVAGSLYTPPIVCGLLAGTFRGELLETGAISERVLLLRDLAEYEDLWFINSVRKWVRVAIRE